MINEKQFANEYNYFWHDILPMSSLFVSQINSSLYQKIAEPYRSYNQPDFRFFLSHLSFNIFKYAHEKEIQISDIMEDYDCLSPILLTTFNQLNFYRSDELDLKQLVKSEYNEVSYYAHFLYSYFVDNNVSKLIITPLFQGCGFHKHCYGDVLCDSTIYEIKTVDRNFKSVDLIQIIIYCALNYGSRQYNIESVGLINPLLGRVFKMELHDFTHYLSGKDPQKLFNEIINFLSLTENSK